MEETKRRSKARWFALAAAAIVLLCGLVLLGGELCVIDLPPVNKVLEELHGLAPAEEADFSVHFIDVGQGDCELILDHGKVMLIDAGEADEAYTVIDYLRRRKIETIDYVVATHPHSDHVGGLPRVMESFEIKNVILPQLSEINTPTAPTYERLLTAVKESGAKVIAAKPLAEYTLGESKFTVLAPMTQDEELNNMSVVLRLTYQNRSFLFMGDAETAVEEQILEKQFDVSCDVLKLGHHGSSSSNSAAFVSAAAPQYAVAECGENNKYGHPHRETVALCRSLGVELLRTDKNGSIVFFVAEDGALTLRKEKQG
ncbi:MAG: MBL fold metallo-hydrolase [Clostridia bacterium]|nr:MBL fold metallo-hydrolase [Clostridia bacterium]